ncbi:unnamed protein product [Schistocephalus solidus]|uniref:Uncharacterized protein n=1 Tax=Schistocephalus solidus TaxID=70667 RepID=A0A3P7CBK1_SCHSO|nr:unnamed protein product [Schistocephalus solidus]
MPSNFVLSTSEVGTPSCSLRQLLDHTHFQVCDDNDDDDGSGDGGGGGGCGEEEEEMFGH